ncbi:hypothetical protein SLE2022_024960 [Rubroshorea leprosula]
MLTLQSGNFSATLGGGILRSFDLETPPPRVFNRRRNKTDGGPGKVKAQTSLGPGLKSSETPAASSFRVNLESKSPTKTGSNVPRRKPRFDESKNIDARPRITPFLLASEDSEQPE